MQDRKSRCFVEGKYFIIDCGCDDERKKLLIYKERKNGSGIKLLPPFDQLWFLPWDLQSYAYIPEQSRIDDCTSFPYPLPQMATSFLVGFAQEAYQIISWSLTNGSNGPIISSGTKLETIFSGIDYLVRWNSTSPVKIGFYTDMPFIGDDVYPLVDNCNIMQLQEGSQGSFTMGNYQDVYITAKSLCDSSTQINLSFQVSIPSSPDLPEPGETRYLAIECRAQCCEYPVFKSKIINYVLVDPKLNPALAELYRKIVATYEALSLPAPPSVPIMSTDALPLAAPIVPTYYVYVIVEQGATTGQRATIRFTAFTLTTNRPERRGYIFGFGGTPYLGFDIQPIITRTRVEYTITINSTSSISRDYVAPQTICVTPYTFANPAASFGYAGEIKDDDGTPIGNVHDWPPSQTFSLSGFFNLPARESNFAIRVRSGTLTNVQPFVKLGTESEGFGNFVVFDRIVISPAP